MPSDPFAPSTDIQPSRENRGRVGVDVDPRLIELSRLYQAALRAGKNPRREEYLALTWTCRWKPVTISKESRWHFHSSKPMLSLACGRSINQIVSRANRFGDFRIGPRAWSRGNGDCFTKPRRFSLGRQ